jgi:hypothetical protein
LQTDGTQYDKKADNGQECHEEFGLDARWNAGHPVDQFIPEAI